MIENTYDNTNNFVMEKNIIVSFSATIFLLCKLGMILDNMCDDVGVYQHIA
jgi:hypothetical protein